MCTFPPCKCFGDCSSFWEGHSTLGLSVKFKGGVQSWRLNKCEESVETALGLSILVEWIPVFELEMSLLLRRRVATCLLNDAANRFCKCNSSFCFSFSQDSFSLFTVCTPWLWLLLRRVIRSTFFLSSSVFNRTHSFSESAKSVSSTEHVCCNEVHREEMLSISFSFASACSVFLSSSSWSCFVFPLKNETSREAFSTSFPKSFVTRCED
mmetsp:Transcript_13458/g.24077  ORF Transcript_13458/g.24077 Transcript_13458/m.24077 type:complete len:210 (-) Transcript_13458:1818-2447(-)